MNSYGQILKEAIENWRNMQRDPIKEPKIGDKWDRIYFEIEILSINDGIIRFSELRKRDNTLLDGFDRRITTFDRLIEDFGYKFVGNDKEKEMTNTENQTDRERAIVSPQIGDRWEFSDGVSIELFGVNKYWIQFVTSHREGKPWAKENWRYFVHAAKFVGNFAPKTEITKRDPLKDPKVGDKWEVTELWHNYNQDVYKGSHLIITDTFSSTLKTPHIRGFFSNGSVFDCKFEDFPARSQVFKFVGNINE